MVTREYRWLPFSCAMTVGVASVGYHGLAWPGQLGPPASLVSFSFPPEEKLDASHEH